MGVTTLRMLKDWVQLTDSTIGELQNYYGMAIIKTPIAEVPTWEDSESYTSINR